MQMTDTMIVRPIVDEAPPTEVVEYLQDDRRWQVSARHASAIQSSGIDWFNLAEGPVASLVKRNSQRDVWRVTSNGKTYFAKLYHPHGLAARLKLLIRGPVALREWAVGRYATSCSIGTVVPIATAWSGSRTDTGPSLLITEAVSDVEPLNEYWLHARENRAEANQITDSLAKLIARAHQCGYRHLDMHPGNILVHPTPSGSEALFVDLHDVAIGRPVSEKQVVANIALLNQWFRRNATLSRRLRFLKTYLNYRDIFAQASEYARNWRFELGVLSGNMRREAAKHASKLWAKRDRRTLRTGKYFAKVQAPGGWRGHVLLRAKHLGPSAAASSLVYEKEQWQQWLQQPLDWVNPAKQEFLKDSHTATVCRATLPTEPDPAVVLVKRPRPRTIWKRIWQMVGPSRNMRAWRISHKLHNRDLPVAQPLAVIERFALGFIRLDSIGFTEFIEGAVDLEAFLTRHVASLNANRQYEVKSRLLANVVRLLKAFGNRGFAHRDLKAPNLLIRWDAPFHGEPVLTFIDMDGISHVRNVSEKQRTRAIVRLCVSLLACPACTRTDRLRFLQAYLTAPGRTPSDWKNHWRQLDEGVRNKQRIKATRRQWKLDHYGRE